MTAPRPAFAGELAPPETHEIEALFARLPPNQHEEAAQLGRRWARVALNEVALEEPPAPGTRAAGRYHVRLQSWCRALGMCTGALAVARARPVAPVPPHRRVPDTLPPEPATTTTPFDLDAEVLP